MGSMDANRGAKRARQARAGLGLDPAAPLDCLLTVVEERAGHPVIVAELPDDIAGACFSEGAGAVLWLNGSKSQSVQRRRFTLAHELGHAWCGHDGTVEVDTFATLSGRTSTPLEVQANAFAAEFLVPRAGLDEVIQREPTLEDTVVVSTHFGVSAIMVVYRFEQLGLVSEQRGKQLEAEINDEQAHLKVAGELDLRPRRDRLARMDTLPYLSPALEHSALAAALRGDDAATAGLTGAVERLLA
ncbi:MAG TPA: ImmA/IrrE family metallo-endopeptidase [Solirubrobacteraceae bacterium]|nr:ImmA/IrrE family metallo-endopeptidase [Solirubrobacteraceae bacterium]